MTVKMGNDTDEQQRMLCKIIQIRVQILRLERDVKQLEMVMTFLLLMDLFLVFFIANVAART